MSFPYNIVSGDGGTHVTAFIDNRMYVANPEHPALADIVTLVTAGDPDVAHLFDATATVTSSLRNHSTRFAMDNGVITFDGAAVENSITTAILRISNTGASYGGLVEFLGNTLENPSHHSREQMYDWLRDRNFTLTTDGCFIAYKGLRDDLGSIHAGPGVVNGTPMHGNLPNLPGSVITMARENVQADSHVGCSVGLHVGTWEYASSFGHRVVKVKVNPRDVVSVPTDCNAQKMRVCRYEVLEEIDNPVNDVYDDYPYDEELEDTYTSEDSLDDPWVTEDVLGDAEFVMTDEWKHDGWSDSYTIQKWENEDEFYLTCSCPSFIYSGGPDSEKSCKHTDQY